MCDANHQMAALAIEQNLNTPLNVPAHAGVQDPRVLTAIEMATILAAGHDLDTMLLKFLSCLTQTLEAAEYGVVFLYNPDTDRLEAGAAQRYIPDYLRRIQLSPGEGLLPLARIHCHFTCTGAARPPFSRPQIHP